MANLEYAKCPNCPNIAHNRKDVKKLFGIRTLMGKYVLVQSWCKECRG